MSTTRGISRKRPLVKVTAGLTVKTFSTSWVTLRKPLDVLRVRSLISGVIAETFFTRSVVTGIGGGTFVSSCTAEETHGITRTDQQPGRNRGNRKCWEGNKILI